MNQILKMLDCSSCFVALLLILIAPTFCSSLECIEITQQFLRGKLGQNITHCKPYLKVGTPIVNISSVAEGLFDGDTDKVEELAKIYGQPIPSSLNNTETFSSVLLKIFNALNAADSSLAFTRIDSLAGEWSLQWNAYFDNRQRCSDTNNNSDDDDFYSPAIFECDQCKQAYLEWACGWLLRVDCSDNINNDTNSGRCWKVIKACPQFMGFLRC